MKVNHHKKTGFYYCRFTVPIYERPVYVVFGHQNIHIFAAFTEHVLSIGKPDGVEGWDEMAYAQTGTCTGERETATYVYFSNQVRADHDLNNTIIHETYHAAMEIAGLSGLEMHDGRTNEHFAYLIGWMGDQIIQAFNSFQNCQNNTNTKDI